MDAVEEEARVGRLNILLRLGRRRIGRHFAGVAVISDVARGVGVRATERGWHEGGL